MPVEDHRGSHWRDTARRLPMALDALVGREGELTELTSLLACRRLVTVTGSAGVGKTRLALEAATTVATGYSDGAVWVSLAGTTGNQVARAVAWALSVGEGPQGAVTSMLAGHLRNARLLLLVDNCEHVAAETAELVDSLLRDCSGVTVLATSRQALDVAGETVWPLAPLATPDAGDDVFGMEASPAVRLFCERARSIRPGFSLTAENAAAVAEICRRLDGVALAIELAAARVAVLAPAQIAARLADRFGLLNRGNRASPGRHRSLRAALDWSHQLCSAPEQALLRRLSVFAGGATLEAAAAVCTGGELASEQVFDTLAALVTKSLLVVQTAGPISRYFMLESVSDYAGECMAAVGEAAAVRTRHARWFAALAESAESGLTGPDQAAWLERLSAEYGNLGAALDWAVAHDEAVLALRLAGALVLWWRVRGSFREGRAYLHAALGIDGGAATGLRAKAAWGAALMGVMMGDTVTASAQAEEALGLYRGLGDARGASRSLLVLANCRLLSGAALAAQPLLEQSVALAYEVDDDWCLAHALALGALSHRAQGEPAPARALAEKAVAVARRSGDAQGLRIGLSLLGELALGQGDLTTAEAALAEALVLTRALDETYGVAVALVGLGEVSLARGDYPAALGLLDEALARAEASGAPGLVADALCVTGRLDRAQHDLAAAATHYDQAVSVTAEANGTCGPALRGIGEVAAARGDLLLAGQLFEQALGLARTSDRPREIAAVLADVADLARAAGSHKRCLELHHEALAIRGRIGDNLGVIQSLEALGGLASVSSRRHGPHAARLLGAASSFRTALGYSRSPAEQHRFESDLATLCECLGDDVLRAALAQGADLSIEEAVASATKGPGRGRPTSGLASLTKAEWDVAALAAAGLTNSQIAERLFIGTMTPKAHLRSVFAKLRISSRVELARMWPSED